MELSAAIQTVETDRIVVVGAIASIYISGIQDDDGKVLFSLLCERYPPGP